MYTKIKSHPIHNGIYICRVCGMVCFFVRPPIPLCISVVSCVFVFSRILHPVRQCLKYECDAPVEVFLRVRREQRAARRAHASSVRIGLPQLSRLAISVLRGCYPQADNPVPHGLRSVTVHSLGLRRL